MNPHTVASTSRTYRRNRQGKASRERQRLSFRLRRNILFQQHLTRTLLDRLRVSETVVAAPSKRPECSDLKQRFCEITPILLRLSSHFRDIRPYSCYSSEHLNSICQLLLELNCTVTATQECCHSDDLYFVNSTILHRRIYKKICIFLDVIQWLSPFVVKRFVYLRTAVLKFCSSYYLSALIDVGLYQVHSQWSYGTNPCKQWVAPCVQLTRVVLARIWTFNSLLTSGHHDAASLPCLFVGISLLHVCRLSRLFRLIEASSRGNVDGQHQIPSGWKIPRPIHQTLT